MLELAARLRVPAAGLVLRVIEHVPQLPSGKVDYQQVGALLGSP
jgi:hypothetical protein